MERLYGCVGRIVDCKDGAPGAAFGVLVIDGRVVD